MGFTDIFKGKQYKSELEDLQAKYNDLQTLIREENSSMVKKNFDKTVEFIDVPDAEQYRVSQKMKNEGGISSADSKDME